MKTTLTKKAVWGEDPFFSGPRDWFRNSIIIGEIIKRKKSGKVLDFGCGSGNVLLRLIKKDYKGVGIDASPLAICYLQNVIEKEKLEKVLTVKQGNEKDLDKINDLFDVVIAGEVLEHLKDEKKAIKSFFALLKKGGVCVISVPAHQWLWDINDDYSSHFRRYEKNELKKMFKEVGFSIEKLFYWGFPLTLFWHRFIFLPLIQKKMTEDTRKNRNPTIKRNSTLKILSPFFSIPFYLDNLFNWTRLGGGLVLVARK